jgi:hypothetical protein
MAANKNIFSYSTLPNGDMQLKGNWDGENITMQLAAISIDSYDTDKRQIFIYARGINGVSSIIQI